MRIIVGKRQTGKTTDLVNLAAERGGFIVCHSDKEAHRVFREAFDQGIHIAYPITFGEFIERHYYAGGIKEFYIDNVDFLLQRLSPGVTVHAFSVTED